MQGRPFNKSPPDRRVNYLDYWEIRAGQAYNLAWITDLELRREKVYQVMRGGRSRWKMANETCNPLKHQDYRLEHPYGQGQKHLATVFGLLLLLAFLVDQGQELCCSLLQAARPRFRSTTCRIRTPSCWDHTSAQGCCSTPPSPPSGPSHRH